MTDIRPITSEDHAAVQAYALEHGSDWQAALRDDWMIARTIGTLQALRNSLGPSCLNAYSIAGYIESEGSAKFEELDDASALAVEAFGLPADFIAIAQEVAPSD